MSINSINHNSPLSFRLTDRGTKRRSGSWHLACRRIWSPYLLPVTILATALTTLSPMLKAAETTSQQTHNEWRCKAKGSEWVCTETMVPGPAYKRPPRKVQANTDSGLSSPKANNLYWIPIEDIDPTLIAESEKQAKAAELEENQGSSAETENNATSGLIPPDQLERLKTGCCGVYMPPVRNDEEAKKTPEDSPARITSLGAMEGNPETILRFSGGVTVIQGSRQLKADSMEMNEIEHTASMEGNIQIREGNSLIIGDSASLNRETGEAQIENSRFVFFETGLRGSASSIERDDDTSMTLTDGEFTQCEPGQEHWLIKGSSITFDQAEETATGKNIRLELGGIPVFYFPYVTFPTGDKSKSGLLYPSFSSDDFPIPLYWSIAPNYDLTFTPRYLRERGISYELETRHLNKYFETTLAGAWLGNGRDEISDNERGNVTIAEATQFDGEDRWLGSIQQTGGRNKKWFTNIDYTKVSDYAYFHHIDTANLDINRSTHLRQSGEAGYNSDNWLVSARAEQYQSVVLGAEEPYQQKPRLSAVGDYQWNDITLSMSNEITRFEHKQRDPSHIEGDRLRLDYQIDWTKEWLWGFFKPSFLLKTLSYQLDDQFLSTTTDDNPNYVVPQGSLDLGLFFERDGSWFGKDYLQTFEPEVFYFYSQYEDQSDTIDSGIDFDTSELTFGYNQLFRHTRFSGGDRIDDANQFSIGLTTRFMGQSGVERLRLSLGQIYYQEDRRVTLDGTEEVQSKSEIAGQVSAQLTDNWRINSDILYDPTERHANKGSLSVRYMDEDFRIFNLGYRYTRKPFGGTASNPVDLDDSQLEASFVWPIAGNWSVIGRNVHDFTYQRELDSIIGLEYTSCCYRVRLMGRRWLDNELINVVQNQDLEYDQGIFLEIHLRGLGLNIGNRIGNALSEGIINYDRREQDFLGE